MKTNMKIPNKIVFILQWFLGILFLLWIIINNKYFAVVTGTLGIMFSTFTLFKPQILPRSKILFSDNVTKTFFNWSQRLINFILLLLSVFILFNYRVSNTLEVGVFILVVSGAIVIIDVLWLIYFWQGAPSTSQNFITLSLIFFSIICAVGIFMVIKNSPVSISEMTPGIVVGIIGSTIGYILHIFWPIKQD